MDRIFLKVGLIIVGLLTVASCGGGAPTPQQASSAEEKVSDIPVSNAIAVTSVIVLKVPGEGNASVSKTGVLPLNAIIAAAASTSYSLSGKTIDYKPDLGWVSGTVSIDQMPDAVAVAVSEKSNETSYTVKMDRDLLLKKYNVYAIQFTNPQQNTFQVDVPQSSGSTTEPAKAELDGGDKSAIGMIHLKSKTTEMMSIAFLGNYKEVGQLFSNGGSPADKSRFIESVLISVQKNTELGLSNDELSDVALFKESKQEMSDFLKELNDKSRAILFVKAEKKLERLEAVHENLRNDVLNNWMHTYQDSPTGLDASKITEDIKQKKHKPFTKVDYIGNLTQFFTPTSTVDSGSGEVKCSACENSGGFNFEVEFSKVKEQEYTREEKPWQREDFTVGSCKERLADLPITEVKTKLKISQHYHLNRIKEGYEIWSKEGGTRLDTIPLHNCPAPPPPPAYTAQTVGKKYEVLKPAREDYSPPQLSVESASTIPKEEPGQRISGEFFYIRLVEENTDQLPFSMLASQVFHPAAFEMRERSLHMPKAVATLIREGRGTNEYRLAAVPTRFDVSQGALLIEHVVSYIGSGRNIEFKEYYIYQYIPTVITLPTFRSSNTLRVGLLENLFERLNEVRFLPTQIKISRSGRGMTVSVGNQSYSLRETEPILLTTSDGRVRLIISEVRALPISVTSANLKDLKYEKDHGEIHFSTRLSIVNEGKFNAITLD